MLIEGDSQHRVVVRLNRVELKSLKQAIRDFKRCVIDGDDQDDPTCQDRIKDFKRISPILEAKAGRKAKS